MRIALELKTYVVDITVREQTSTASEDWKGSLEERLLHDAIGGGSGHLFAKTQHVDESDREE